MPDYDPKRTVYILGAGFSAAAKAPVMDGFFDEMQSCYFGYQNKLSAQDKEAFKFALEFRQHMAASNDNFVVRLDNLEELFGLLEVEIVKGVRTGDDRKKFVRAILRTLELCIQLPQHKTSKAYINFAYDDEFKIVSKLMHSDPFGHLLGEATAVWIYHVFAALVAISHLERPGRGDSIITFNYDLILDQALHEIGAKVDYCNTFPAKASNYPNSHNARFKTDVKVPLYKLHGSANWIRCDKDRESQRRFLASPMGPVDDPALGLMDQSLLACPDCQKHPDTTKADPALHSAIIVPPTWNKALYQTGMESVWKAAVNDLSNAGRVVVIGFSLPSTDVFFKYLLAAGFPIGKAVNVYLFDPSDLAFDRYSNFLSKTFAERRFKRIDEITIHAYKARLNWEGWRGHFGVKGIEEVIKLVRQDGA